MPGFLQNVLFGAGLAFAAAIQPGPLQAFLVSRVLAIGWRQTLPACAAPLVSDGPIAVLAVLVLGRVPAGAQSALRAAGGVLLLYLATKALGQWRHPAAPSSQTSAPRTVLEAAMINVLNPNPYLAWALVLGPAVVAAWRQQPVYAIGLVGAFYATLVGMNGAFVFLVGTARFLNPRRQRALVGISAFVLAALGVALLGASRFWVLGSK